MALLSHYTTFAGLKGIAKTRAFWATNFLSLNDTSEFFYAWRRITETALKMAMERIPDAQKQPGHDVKNITKDATNQLKQLFRSTAGYGHLYVTSFARGTTKDHNERGIRTLWELYNGHKGYCLQFDQNDICRMLERDSQVWNYEGFGLAEVKYGVDENERDFRELCFQLSKQFLLQIIRARNDIRIELQWDSMWPDSTLHRKLMEYCATHKDPCYEDEREMRIFVYPASSAEARVFFTGIAAKKKIMTCDNGKKYIAIGEDWKPGIVPRRVIIGTKADPDIDSILANYSPVPEVVFANMPIA